MHRLASIGLVFGIVCCGVPGRAAILLVPQQFSTIQAAINASANNDTILVGPGTYAERIDASGHALSIRSTAGPAFTILDGQNAGTVVTWTSAPAQSKLEGFQIINGRGPDGAAPLPVRGGQNGSFGGPGGMNATVWLKVSDCVFRDNRGGNGSDGLDAAGSIGLPTSYDAGGGGTGGPGVAQVSSTVFFVFCTFSSNRGGDGGAGGKPNRISANVGHAGAGGPGCLVTNNAFLSVYLSRFRSNQGGTGGHGADANPVGTEATLPSAGGTGGAGAIAHGLTTITIANCLFDRNLGGAGGLGGDGISLPGGAIVVGASGGLGGPGVAGAFAQGITLRQVTTYSNAGGAGGNGGAIQGQVGSNGPGLIWSVAPTTVRNCMLVDDFDILFVPGFSATYSAITGGAPGFGSVDTTQWPFVHGYRLGLVAAYIDSADSAEVPFDGPDVDGDLLTTAETLPVDLSGGPRLIDTPEVSNTGHGSNPRPDMGAYEFNGIPAIAAGDANCDGMVNNFDIDPFVLALTQPIVYEHVYRNCWTGACDTDNDGVLTNFDIDPFVALLVN